jgi:hypothetical protein
MLAAATVFTLLSLGAAWLYWIVVMLSRSGHPPFSMESSGILRESVVGTLVWAALRVYPRPGYSPGDTG